MEEAVIIDMAGRFKKEDLGLYINICLAGFGLGGLVAAAVFALYSERHLRKIRR